MKTHNVFFAQVSREIWNYNLSDKAKLLFFWLNELEQRYTEAEGNGIFYRSDEMLAADMGWSLKTLKAAKAELKKTDLIRTSRVYFEKDGKRSSYWVTGYEILK